MKTIYLAETESTNDYAKNLQNAESGMLIIADRQTKGKGTKRRGFISPLGGLYMSVILRPNIALNLLTPMAAVAVRRAVNCVLGVNCGIKWVNDLYLDGKKVCGILTENKFEGDKVTAIIGIGIDVFKPSDGYGEYSSVAGYITDKAYDKAVLIALAEAVRDNLSELNNDKDKEFLKEYSDASVLTGESVDYTQNGTTERVTVVGIDEAARLIIRYQNGVTEHVINGEIAWKK